MAYQLNYYGDPVWKKSDHSGIWARAYWDSRRDCGIAEFEIDGVWEYYKFHGPSEARDFVESVLND